jgi:hypothetical protein
MEAGSCEDGDKPSGAIREWEFLYQLRHYCPSRMTELRGIVLQHEGCLYTLIYLDIKKNIEYVIVTCSVTRDGVSIGDWIY